MRGEAFFAHVRKRHPAAFQQPNTSAARVRQTPRHRLNRFKILQLEDGPLTILN
jgi:hypothetical protein